MLSFKPFICSDVNSLWLPQNPCRTALETDPAWDPKCCGDQGDTVYVGTTGTEGPGGGGKRSQPDHKITRPGRMREPGAGRSAEAQLKPALGPPTVCTLAVSDSIPSLEPLCVASPLIGGRSTGWVAITLEPTLFHL